VVCVKWCFWSEDSVSLSFRGWGYNYLGRGEKDATELSPYELRNSSSFW
jgi:hypothetical protein